MSIKQLTAIKLKQRLDANDTLLLLDVREPNEFNYANIAGSTLLPLNQLPARLDELDKNQAIVAICHHGMRSMQAATFLAHSGFTDISNLQGGIDAWSRDCDDSVKRY
jgi:rhodanese-related sulfurtransferase